MRNRAASLLARLKNKAKDQGIPLQLLINLFCQEEFIRRLSQSNYKDHLILKGGFLLYSISSFTSRPTIDADYLLNDFSNDLKAIENLLEDVISTDSENEFVEFEIRGLEKISEMKEYLKQRGRFLLPKITSIIIHNRDGPCCESCGSV